jgi:hypothetical protein
MQRSAATVAAYEEAGVETVRIFDGLDWDEPCKSVNGTTQTLDWYRKHPTQHPNCSRAASAARDV